MNNDLRTLFEQRRLRIGAEPLERLIHLLGGADSATGWDDKQGISHGRIVVVDEPPRLLQVDAFCHSLSPTATVVIPFSEDPAFDYLKSRLQCHGMIGAHAPHSPHQIWWGGLLPAKPSNGYLSVREAHLVSSIRRDTHEDTAGVHFAKALDALNISYSIERNEPDVCCDDRPELRSRLLLDAWTRTDKPLIWIDPNCAGDPSALSLDLRGADFAATQTPDAKFSTNFLYFGRSSATFELLKNWNKLCEEFQQLPAHHLLDATWALITSQRSLLTVWVPPYKGPEIDQTIHDGSALPSQPGMSQLALHDSAHRHARRARRTSAPEPQCVLNSRFGGRGTLTLLVRSSSQQRTRRPRQWKAPLTPFSEPMAGSACWELSFVAMIVKSKKSLRKSAAAGFCTSLPELFWNKMPSNPFPLRHWPITRFS